VPAAERRALVVCDDEERAARHVSVLRRANLSVSSASEASQADLRIRRRPIDLIVFVQPFPGAARLAAAARSEGSPSRGAGIVLVTDGTGDAAGRAVERHANRKVSNDDDLAEFERAVSELLAVAPRVKALPGSRLSLVLRSGSRLRAELENFSVSGLFLRVPGQLPVGHLFGFELWFPGEPDPIRGRARVVRVASPPSLSGQLVAARILALGGEGPRRLAAVVGRERAPAPGESSADTTGEPPGAGSDDASSGPTTVSSAPRLDRDEAERCRLELAELNPVLDRILERGLRRRLLAAEWYVTGAELGLESLRAFSGILASIFENRAISPAAERRLADLVEVRGQLAEFGRPAQDLESRVRILIALRPALERLLRELAETGAAAGTGLAGAQAPGVVSLSVAEIRRLVGLRRALGQLGERLDDLRKLRLPFSGGGTRHGARQIAEEYGPVVAALGIELDAERLLRRRLVHDTVRAVATEERGAVRRLAAIHAKAFSLAFRRLATDDVEADLLDPKLHLVLVETLRAGGDYLARAYGAYRHALEVIGADPSLIDRVERLGARLSVAERTDQPVVGSPDPSIGELRGA